MTRLALLFGALLLAGCAGSGEPAAPPRTVDAVDLERYQGTWYELARLPMFFQRHCTQSEAHYSLQPDDTVGVRNRCRTAEGEWKEAQGQATPQVEGRTDKLWVRFDNWFSRLAPDLTRGQYWVLYVDENYQTALVGHPDRTYLWLLSRTPEVPEHVRRHLLELARGQGYDTDGLIWRTADDKMPR